MENKFWIEEKSIEHIYEEFKLSENPNGSFWDIFEPKEEFVDASPEWKKKQSQLISNLIEKYFEPNSLDYRGIANVVTTIQHFTYPRASEDFQILEEAVTSDWISHNIKLFELCKTISKRYVMPLRLNESTLIRFLELLDNALVVINKTKIKETKREEYIRVLYQENDKEIANKMIKEGYLDEILSEVSPRYPEEQAEPVDNFIYPNFLLAYSTTFYGFDDDGGNLSYEEQEQIAQQKFKEYQVNISKLLNQEPNNKLLPNRFDFENNKASDKYYQLAETNPFMYEFDGAFSVWNNNNKVLFISMNKEDKELPYEIIIGSLTLNKYTEILKKFNSITNSK